MSVFAVFMSDLLPLNSTTPKKIAANIKTIISAIVKHELNIYSFNCAYELIYARLKKKVRTERKQNMNMLPMLNGGAAVLL